MGSSIVFINSIINAFVGITCIVTANSSYKVASFLTEKQTNPNKI